VGRECDYPVSPFGAPAAIAFLFGNENKQLPVSVVK
jgi:hypothetical protein